MIVCKKCGSEVEKVKIGSFCGDSLLHYFCQECRKVRGPRNIKVIKEEKF